MVLREHGSFPSKNAWYQAAGGVRKPDFLKAIDSLVCDEVVVREGGVYHFAADDATNE